MYAETGLFFSYMQNFSQDIPQFEDYYYKTPNSSSTMTSSISDYNLGGEGDLFNAPEPIIEEPLMALDPITAAINMMSCGEGIIPPQGLDVLDLESFHSEQQFLNNAFYDCEQDLMVKSAMESPFSEVLDIKIPMASIEETPNEMLDEENKVVPEIPLHKSISSGNLSSMEWTHGAAMTPKFPDFRPVDFGAVYGMRRAFSEGDIQNLNNRNLSVGNSPLDRVIVNCTSEYRREKLSRYRNKKTKRNFGRKIKYACRKALADSQPRIRGRFAKTDEPDVPRRQEL